MSDASFRPITPTSADEPKKKIKVKLAPAPAPAPKLKVTVPGSKVTVPGSKVTVPGSKVTVSAPASSYVPVPDPTPALSTYHKPPPRIVFAAGDPAPAPAPALAPAPAPAPAPKAVSTSIGASIDERLTNVGSLEFEDIAKILTVRCYIEYFSGEGDISAKLVVSNRSPAEVVETIQQNQDYRSVTVLYADEGSDDDYISLYFEQGYRNHYMICRFYRYDRNEFTEFKEFGQ